MTAYKKRSYFSSRQSCPQKRVLQRLQLPGPYRKDGNCHGCHYKGRRRSEPQQPWLPIRLGQGPHIDLWRDVCGSFLRDGDD